MCADDEAAIANASNRYASGEDHRIGRSLAGIAPAQAASGSAVLLAPIPGQELVNAPGGMIRQPRQDVGEAASGGTATHNSVSTDGGRLHCLPRRHREPEDRLCAIEADYRLHSLAPPNRGGLNSTHIHGAHVEDCPQHQQRRNKSAKGNVIVVAMRTTASRAYPSGGYRRVAGVQGGCSNPSDFSVSIAWARVRPRCRRNHSPV
jgi:hypothetical protein